MSELLDDLFIRPLRIYTVDTRRWHHALSEYYHVFEQGTTPEGKQYWVIGFEDLDRLDAWVPDWDFNQPKIRVELVNQYHTKITGLSYSARFHNRLFYGSELIFDLRSGEYSNFGDRTIPISTGLTDINALSLLVLQRLLVTQLMNVDTLATEDSVSDEIDPSVDTSPVKVLSPPEGQRISTRGAYLFSDATSGEVELCYETTGKILVKLLCSRYYNATLPVMHTVGETDEKLEINWTGLSPASKIFYLIAYKYV